MTIPAYLTAALRYIDTWLQHQNQIDTHTPGHAIAINYQGRAIFNKSYGFADIKTQTPLANHHIFRIASHSKTFTSVALFQLMENGKLDIYAPVSQYLSFLLENPDPRMHDVTIAQILSHKAGIMRDGNDPSYWILERDYPSAEELITSFKQAPLIIDAEQVFKYSNFGYGLLGLVIEEVSGKSYDAYMQDHILQPLNLSNIGTDHHPDIAMDYVTGYTAKTAAGRQVAIRQEISANVLAAATGFYANAETLCHFYAALMTGTGQLLSDTSKQMMMAQIQDIPGELPHRKYGLGLSVEKPYEHTLFGHTGCMPGCMSKTLFNLEKQITISILTNSNSGAVAGLQSGAWQIIDFFQKYYQENAPFAKYAGRFYDIWGVSDYVPLGDKIYIASPSLWEPFGNCTELSHISNDTFQITKDRGYASYMETVRFTMEDDIAKRVHHGGYPKYNAEDYQAYLDNLEKDNA